MEHGQCEREEVSSAAQVDILCSDGLQGAAGTSESLGEERQAQGNLLASRASEQHADAVARGTSSPPSIATAAAASGQNGRGDPEREGGRRGKGRQPGQGTRKSGASARPPERRKDASDVWTGMPQQQRREAQALLVQAEAIAQDAEMSPEQKVQQLHASIKRQAGWLVALERDLVLVQQRLVEMQQEKDATAAEMGKSAALRSKLEALCRELQAQNKAIIAEGKALAEMERQKREELSNHFLSSIKDVEVRLGEQGDAQLKVIDDNRRLVEQMHKASQKAELREKEWEYEAKKFAMEQRILELKVQQQVQLAIKERTEKEEVLQQLLKQHKEHAALQEEMAGYGKRFQECQEMMAKSNEVMQSFKEDRKTMMKRMQEMEEDMTALRLKGSKSDASLIELVQERNALKKQVQSLSNQKAKLESLCRTLQDERKKSADAVAPPPSTGAENAIAEG